MPPELPGLHHVTAITGDAPGNVAFYTRVLGLRLVKKTVNQDDLSAYHLFYGDAKGSPGMDLTFFDWPHAPGNVPGAGTVARIALAVPDAAALRWWQDRFARLRIAHGEIADRRGRQALAFTDPEGQCLELVDGSGAGGPPVEPWAGSPVPVEVGIRSFYGVTIYGPALHGPAPHGAAPDRAGLRGSALDGSAPYEAALYGAPRAAAAPSPTVALLTGLLGFWQTDAFADAEGRPVTVLESGTGGAGTEVRVVSPRGPQGMPGIGGVHHIALRTASDATQHQWLEILQAARVPNSGIVDRYYFRSLYFREPGGVLLEIATDGPGFATDETPGELGRRLALPPFLEPRRAQIEAGLTPLPTDGPGARGPAPAADGLRP